MTITPIPTTQLAAVSRSKEAGTVVETIPVVQPEDLKPGQALVRLRYSGVCHSDYSLIHDEFALPTPRPCIAGHEGTGEIVALNDPITKLKVGDRVGIKYIIHSCNQCETCLAGDEAICAEAKHSVFDEPGTFQQYAVSYTSQLTPIPANLDLAIAAPVLCAGLTVWRALKESNTRAGQWIAIPGAGGGLGSLAVQYAVFMGLNVIAIDSGADKQAMCEANGVRAFLDFKLVEDMVSAIQGATTDGRGPHAALVTSPKVEAYTLAMRYIRPGGRVVAVGIPPEGSEFKADMLTSVVERKSIVTSYVGSRLDALEALQIVADGHVKQQVVVEPLRNIDDIYRRMHAGKVAGRVVVDLWQ
ncbi:Alcohol dehydrogenase 1 [Vanrija pseudolonga]|uniref:alcohol dehydrogenase n=1 Tax=Vanrija pseudolonga TaxID=143232 RepID=A0AAF1BI26_9TREE|nr:Alcohol dehydrogenase 1 [Vanrija pseudolonga]